MKIQKENPKKDFANKEKNQRKMETMISTSLRAGVYLSAIIILFGFILFLVTGNSGYKGSTFPYTVSGVCSGILALKPYAIILLGLMLLIFTPVFRVGVSIVMFVKTKDYIFVLITGFVFLILILSMLIGFVE